MPKSNPQDKEQIPNQNSEQHSFEYDNEDQIDIVALVAILWHRRWLMVGVFIFIVGLAIAYCFIATPKYEITAQISPGITGFGSDGQPMRAWSAKDIQNWYSKNGYIVSLAELLKDNRRPPKIVAGVSKGSNLVHIRLDWFDPEEGKLLLKSSIDILSKRGGESIQQLIGNRRTIENQIYQFEKDKEKIIMERERLNDEVQRTKHTMVADKQVIELEIFKLRKELEQFPITKIRINNQIEKAENMMNVLENKLSSITKYKGLASNDAKNFEERIGIVTKNIEELIQLRNNKFAGDLDKFDLLMYSNIVQQNISYVVSMQDRLEIIGQEINQYEEEEVAKNREIESLKIEIKNLELKRDQELKLKEDGIKKNLQILEGDLIKKNQEILVKLKEFEINRNQELKIKFEKLKSNIDALNIKMSTLGSLEINQPPFNSPRTVKPEKIKIVAVAIVLGCLFSVISAYLAEFIIKNRSKLTANYSR